MSRSYGGWSGNVHARERILKLDGQRRQNLLNAMAQAIPDEDELVRVVSIGLNENLYAIAGGRTLTDKIFYLIRWAESKGRLDELLATLTDRYPGNPMLRSIIEDLRTQSTDLAEVDADLEKIVNQHVKFADAEYLLERLRKCIHAVCRIEIPVGVPKGTGFLLGPDLAITNYHVMESIVGGSSKKDEVVFRFDYKSEGAGKILNHGVEYSLAVTTDWPITSSITRKLDYILMRVVEKRIKASEQQVNQSMNRPWLTPCRHQFTTGEPLFILQHPQGIPLQFAAGSVLSTESGKARVFYTANTLDGSSGSPCFTSDGALVALHRNKGDRLHNRNEGVIFKNILEDLQRKDLLEILGDQIL